MSQDPPRTPAQLSSLRETFPGYFPPNDDQMRAFLTAGMVVLDTNALLDTYMLVGTARSEFLGTLRTLGDRLFIPHHAGLEFMRNRANVIRASNAFPERFRYAAEKLHREVQAFKERSHLRDEDVRGIKDAIDSAVEQILRMYTELHDHGVTPGKNIEQDPVFKELEELTAGKVGAPFAQPEEVAKVGVQRLKDKVPPGYSDVAKAGDGALGDFFLWEQTIVEAKQRQLPVLLVNNDLKQDWVQREGGFLRGPRPELVAEMLARANQPFHLVTVKMFLTLARRYLRAQVSDSTIEQAEMVQQQAGKWRASKPIQLDEEAGRLDVGRLNLGEAPEVIFTSPDARR